MTRDDLLKIRLGLLDSELGESRFEAIAILDAELAKPEPYAVARVDDLERGGRVRALALKLSLDAPLYTAPPAAKEWVGLTDEEIQPINITYGFQDRFTGYARAIEAALRAKNTGEQA